MQKSSNPCKNAKGQIVAMRSLTAAYAAPKEVEEIIIVPVS